MDTGQDQHGFSDYLACHCPDFVKVRVPELGSGLMHTPSLVDEETVDDAGPVIAPSSFLGGLDDFLGYDLAVRARDLFRLEVAWYTLLD